MTTFECMLLFSALDFRKFHAPFWKREKKKPPHAVMMYPSAVKCEQVLKPLGLVRYRLALSAWALKFYDSMAELVKSTVRWKVKSESDEDSLSLMAQGNRCGNRARCPAQYNSKRCFTEAIVLHTYMHGFMGLAGGSVTSSRAPHQQLAFTTLYGFMKYILTRHVILCNTMETQTINSVTLSQKCYGSWCYSSL